RGSIRTQVGAELEDPKYRGKRVSRKDIYESEEEEEEEGDDDVSESEGSDLAGFDEELNEDDDEVVGSSDGEGPDEEAGGDESGGDSEAEDEEEEEEDEEEDDEDAPPRSEARLAKELEQLEAEETKLVKTMSASAKSDVEKGHHVRAQITLWDGLLDSRIRIQRAVAVANRLPHPSLYPAFVSSSPTAASAIADTSDSLVTLIDSLITLRTSLAAQNPSLSSLLPSPKRKRDDFEDGEDIVSAVWADVHPLDEAFRPFRSQTINKWNAKVQVAQGIPLQKKFKAVNQSTVAQIESVLLDRSRLVKRAQLRRSDDPPIGYPKKTEAEVQEDDGKGTGDAHLAAYDVEVFDDGDYYQQLLKELIESRMTDSDDAVLNSLKWAHFKSLKQTTRKKKKVDTRASKGRKVRFHVHDKLLNYMAPEPRGSWHDDMVDELFAGLLGQDAAGNPSQAPVGDGMDVDAEPLVAADGFRIM
ncbi:hypothetical protein HKX48_001954, partial [Thoreauomyces humboldtii]